jgi:hypothetical protein
MDNGLPRKQAQWLGLTGGWLDLRLQASHMSLNLSGNIASEKPWASLGGTHMVALLQPL